MSLLSLDGDRISLLYESRINESEVEEHRSPDTEVTIVTLSEASEAIRTVNRFYEARLRT
jgi:hypothetical protein